MKVRKKTIARKPVKSGGADARRFASILTKVLVVAGGIIALIMVANRWAGKEDVQDVRILGRTVLDTAEILEIAAIPDTIPVAKMNLEEIENRVASHPYIQSASVYRGEAGTLILEIVERSPVAVTVVQGAPAYLDAQGVPLSYRFSSAGFDVPVVSGIIDSTGAAIDSLEATEALAVLQAVKKHSEALYRMVAEIRRGSDGEYTLYYTDGAIPIKAGKPDGIEARLKTLQAFITSVLTGHRANDLRYIDLRWNGQVVVNWRVDPLLAEAVG